MIGHGRVMVITRAHPVGPSSPRMQQSAEVNRWGKNRKSIVDGKFENGQVKWIMSATKYLDRCSDNAHPAWHNGHSFAAVISAIRVPNYSARLNSIIIICCFKVHPKNSKYVCHSVYTYLCAGRKYEHSLGTAISACYFVVCRRFAVEVISSV